MTHRDLSPLAAAAAAGPARTVFQAISCRPEDVRVPSKRGGGGRNWSDPEAEKHHGGSHRNYMEYKIEKLGEQNDALQAADGVFAGVSIWVNGLTEPSWLELRDIMLANGGRFANYYSRAAVTHIVCAHLTDSKIEKLKRSDKHHPPVARGGAQPRPPPPPTFSRTPTHAHTQRQPSLVRIISHHRPADDCV